MINNNKNFNFICGGLSKGFFVNGDFVVLEEPVSVSKSFDLVDYIDTKSLLDHNDLMFVEGNPSDYMILRNEFFSFSKYTRLNKVVRKYLYVVFSNISSFFISFNFLLVESSIFGFSVVCYKISLNIFDKRSSILSSYSILFIYLFSTDSFCTGIIFFNSRFEYLDRMGIVGGDSVMSCSEDLVLFNERSFDIGPLELDEEEDTSIRVKFYKRGYLCSKTKYLNCLSHIDSREGLKWDFKEFYGFTGGSFDSCFTKSVSCEVYLNKSFLHSRFYSLNFSKGFYNSLSKRSSFNIEENIEE